ncbi:MAG: MBL fold metallo-hydrolase [Saprospiraceae bacterium]|nr:MBL fold metallo-hydrolase [Saprospiraceae bacterium]
MRLSTIHCGYFKLDGGAMFGIVPRRMWEKANPPDEMNLCTWSLQCLLVQTGDRNILIDTGMGNKQDEKFRSHFKPFGEQNLFSSLEQAGMRREDITDVFLTHLHFDHCGGAIWKNEATGQTELAFPNATYWSNERHFKSAMNPNERERASFLKENFVPLMEQKRLKFIPLRQNVEFVPGIRIKFFNGHTDALMAPVIRADNGREIVYCADALPSQWHISMPWVMAYDIRPLVTLQDKARLLGTAAKRQQVLFFEHDPVAECGTVFKDEHGRIKLDKSGLLSDFQM